MSLAFKGLRSQQEPFRALHKAQGAPGQEVLKQRKPKTPHGWGQRKEIGLEKLSASGIPGLCRSPYCDFRLCLCPGLASWSLLSVLGRTFRLSTQRPHSLLVATCLHGGSVGATVDGQGTPSILGEQSSPPWAQCTSRTAAARKHAVDVHVQILSLTPTPPPSLLVHSFMRWGVHVPLWTAVRDSCQRKDCPRRKWPRGHHRTGATVVPKTQRPEIHPDEENLVASEIINLGFTQSAFLSPTPPPCRLFREFSCF